MSYVYSKRITKETIGDFHEAFNAEILPKINDFLRQYNLSAKGANLTYDDHGIDIKVSSIYELGDGSKPWAESTMREKFEAEWSWLKRSQANPVSLAKADAFMSVLPSGKLIGNHIHIPGSSKRYPDETFTLTDYNPDDRYPLKVTRDRDGKRYNWEFNWDIRFVDYVK